MSPGGTEARLEALYRAHNLAIPRELYFLVVRAIEAQWKIHKLGAPREIEIAAPMLPMTLATDLDLESVEVAYLVVGLENEFGIRVSDSEWSHVFTLGDMIKLLAERVYAR
jgi:acyl carrier protein